MEIARLRVHYPAVETLARGSHPNGQALKQSGVVGASSQLARGGVFEEALLRRYDQTIGQEHERY